ncbi:hypothetical protein HHK36_010210 [Tetracentron sinense]|uniref:B box-type domain-containing protein n=1 Tax=Tetracentron sinense TaxID=13715 RepID=A0A834ZMZ9_TETSI|nr:hypothetical protein HHK36_010210 [Tetracentron sinense]
MKIQCDVCNKQEASLFCSADEAALCDSCDRRVHHANKLAVKHHRFSLLHPSSNDTTPRCDICQERRGFLFCQEDRAILCSECDLSIHKANEHTQKHNRFLLTGVKLSASSALYSNTTTTSTGDCCDASEISSTPQLPSEIPNQASIEKPKVKEGSTSSIAEYLIDILPGWHVEDFLDSSSAPDGFCKTYDHLLPFLDDDVQSNLSTSFYSEDLAIWVPQAPPPAHHLQYPPQLGRQIGFKENSKEATNLKVGRKWSDDGFTVPQISPPSAKRCRPF